MDMANGTLQYWVDVVELPLVKHEVLKGGEWFLTVTFESGASGASFELQH
jgi:hypothetical protein